MNNRNLSIDILRIIACLGVIILHTVGHSDKILLPIYYLGTISIPLYFMISGYLIMLKKEVSYKYIIEKIVNSVIFVLIWSGIATVILFVYERKVLFLDIFIGTFTQHNLMAILWFMWAIIIMYLLSPILRKIINNDKLKNKFLLLLIFLSEIIYIINITVFNNNKMLICNIVPQILRLWTWITYYYIGMYICNIKNKIKCTWKLVIVMIIFMIMYEFLIGNYILSDLRAENFYDSGIIKIVVIYLFVFILNKQINFNSNYVIKMSQFTMGIYAIHYIIIAVLKKIINYSNIYINIINVLIVFILSYLFCYIVDKIPVINKIINNKFIS